MSILDTVWDEFLDKFDRIPVWLPGTSMSLGDIGTVDRRGYIRLANLADFGVAYQGASADVQTSYYVASRNAATKDFELTGSALPGLGTVADMRAGIHARFTAAGAFVVRAENVNSERIEDVLEVERQISIMSERSAFWNKRWNRRWVYVSEVATAQPCIVLISGSEDAEAKVVGSADLGPAGLAGLGGASASLRLAQQSGIDQYIVTVERSPFMWRGRSQRGWFGKAFTDRGDTVSSGDEFEEFDDPEAFKLQETGEIS